MIFGQLFCWIMGHDYEFKIVGDRSNTRVCRRCGKQSIKRNPINRIIHSGGSVTGIPIIKKAHRHEPRIKRNEIATSSSFDEFITLPGTVSDLFSADSANNDYGGSDFGGGGGDFGGGGSGGDW